MEFKSIVNHTKEDKDPSKCGVCSVCKNWAHDLNHPISIKCKGKAHCICEVCFMTNAKYENGLVFECPLHFE